MSNTNGLYYASNSGAILRKLFPKQLNTQALIIIWSIIFILNIVVVVLIQNFAIYKITDVSNEGLSGVAYFENCEIVNAEETITEDGYYNIYCVIYRNESNEERIVCLEQFPNGLFQRYRLKTATDCAVDEDGIILYENGDALSKVTRQEYVQLANPTDVFSTLMLYSGKFIQKLAFIYIGCGLVLLGIEFFFYSIFHRLFRE